MKKASIQEILTHTIKELMAKHEPDAITVRKILEESGISRPTFYKYFCDKQNLIEFVFESELAKPFFWDFSKGLEEREVLFLEHLSSYRSFYLNALKTTGQNSFYHMWIEQALSSLYGFLRRNLRIAT